jgi:hypothetical protein
MRNAQKILIGQPEKNIRRCRYRYGDIKIDLGKQKEMVWTVFMWLGRQTVPNSLNRVS